VSVGALHERTPGTQRERRRPPAALRQPSGSAPTAGRSPVLRLAVQRLPEVSETHDPLEAEAAQAAQRIVAGQPAGPISSLVGGPQRVAVGEEETQRVAVGEEEVGEEPVQRLVQRLAQGRPAMTPGLASTLRFPSGGSPLPPSVRAAIEPGLGVDLGGVRVHDGAQAHDATALLQARAATYGSHLFLGRGESAHDLPLMAHEATHVVQQGAIGPAPGPGAGAAGGGQVQRQAALIPDVLADYARYVPGYTLLTVIVGVDPITGEAVERNAVNLVGGLMGLSPLGTVVFDKLVELGLIDQAFAFVDRQLATFDLSIARLEAVVSEAWNEMELIRGFDHNLGILVGKFTALVEDVAGFAGSLLSALVDMVREAAIGLAEPLLDENPAWSLIKKVLHYDPLRGVPVEATTVEILEDFLRLIGRETEIEQMRAHGTLQETADWIDSQLEAFGSLVSDLGALFAAAWNAIQPENLPNLQANLQTLALQAFALLQRALDFAATVAAKVLELVKTALLGWLSEFALEVPGFHLLTVILGRNPFTGEEVPRSAENLIRGFITLLPGGNATYDQLAQSGVIGQAAARIEGAMSELGISWEMVTGLFRGIWDGLSIDDLVDPIGAFVRIRDQFGEPILRLFAFVRVVLSEIFQLILALMNFPTEMIIRIITNAMQAYEDISQDPVGFFLNMMAAVKEGFTRFFGGIWDHLLSGLMGWLFRGLRGAGIEPPTELTLQSALDLLMQILGITVDRLWEKLAERIGQDRVDQIRDVIDKLTGIWTFVRDVQEQGPSAIWKYIQGQLSNLWNTIIQYVATWLMERIITQGIVKLLSFLDPTFIMSVVNGFIAIFQAIQSTIEYIRDLLEIVDHFVGTIASVARGDIDPGAAMLEEGLIDAVPVAIGFLAAQVGLGNVSDKIAEIVGGVREVVDSALDWLMDQAEAALQSILKTLGFGAGADEEPGTVAIPDAKATKALSMAGEGHTMTATIKAGQLLLKMASGEEFVLRQLARAVIEEVEGSTRSDEEKAFYRGIMVDILNRTETTELQSTYKNDGEPANADSWLLKYITNIIEQDLVPLAGHGIKSLTDFLAKIPPVRFLPPPYRGQWIRWNLYVTRSEWSSIRTVVEAGDRKQIQNDVRRANATLDRRLWDTLQIAPDGKRGYKIPSWAVMGSYTEADVLREPMAVDHILPLARHWTYGGGHNADDKVRSPIGKGRTNLELVTGEYNSRKQAQGADYRTSVDALFESDMASSTKMSAKIKDLPFLRAEEGGPIL
jgi:Domain of unknown function (DUF4157)